MVKMSRPKGFHLTDEHKKRISKALKGRKFSDSTIQKMRDSRPECSGSNNPMYGKHHSDETKRKISEANSGSKNGMYNKLYTDEERLAISNRLKNHACSSETRGKISKANSGKNNGLLS